MEVENRKNVCPRVNIKATSGSLQSRSCHDFHFLNIHAKTIGYCNPSEGTVLRGGTHHTHTRMHDKSAKTECSAVKGWAQLDT
jgi:hypothetical protein